MNYYLYSIKKNVLRINLFLLFIFLLSSQLPSNVFASIHPVSKYTKLTIFTFNNSSDILGEDNDSYILSQIKKRLDEQRHQVSNHFTVLTGDIIYPSIATSIDKGKSTIDLLNMMDIDYAALGNHEFDYGGAELKKRIESSNFSWLASNVLNLSKNKISNTDEYVVINVDGIKVGIMGLITPKTRDITKVGKDYYFLPIVQTAKNIVKKMKMDRVDVIIVLSHLTYKEIKNLSQSVDDIHLIIGGHDREIMSVKDNKTYVYANAKKDGILTKINIMIETKEGFHEKSVSFLPSLCLIDLPHEKDYEMERYISLYKDRYKKYLNQNIALISDDIDSSFDSMRTKETVLGDIASDAIRYETDADIGFLTSGFFRGDRVYPKNSIFTQKDLLNEFSFDDKIVVIEVSGQDILDALENGVSEFEKKEGRFPQVSGMSFSFDLTQKAYSRISKVRVKGKNLVLDKKYLLATTDFIAKGGDGYLCFYKNETMEKENISFIRCISRYIQSIKNISNIPQNRIISINTD